jgi:hypothetical protein
LQHFNYTDDMTMQEQTNSTANLDRFNLQPLGELDINDPSEVRRWMQHWNVSEVDLRKAVAEVGTDIAEVRSMLGK